MHPHRRPLIAVVAVGIAGGAVALAVATTGAPQTSHGTRAAGESSCAKRLLRDWTDGRIDGTYPLACYRSALRSLPTDLRMYSSAPDDIRQALSMRIVQGRAQKVSGAQGARSVRKLASAAPIAPSRSSSTLPARASSAKLKPPR